MGLVITIDIDSNNQKLYSHKSLVEYLPCQFGFGYPLSK